jgi:hypothetical protein
MFFCLTACRLLKEAEKSQTKKHGFHWGICYEKATTYQILQGQRMPIDNVSVSINSRRIIKRFSHLA